MAGYPAHREADVVLRDGSTVRLRPVRPDDDARLLDFFSRLDPTSQSFRFFSGAPDLQGSAHDLAGVDYSTRYGLIAGGGDGGRPVGHGVYLKVGDGRAEVAFAIAAEMQGRGLGTILLAHLAEAAAENGIDTFEAEVLPQNHRMLEMFRESGFPIVTRADPGVIHVEMPTTLSPEAVSRFEDRDRSAAVEAVRAFMEPGSVAVVGASRDVGRVGGAVLHNLLASGFPGEVHAVNPAAAEVQGVPAVGRIEEAGAGVDLAVIAVPAERAIAVARECAAIGVRAIVVLSAGFGESGPEGADRERELLRVCRDAGMRLIGPNCLGLLNTDPDRPLDASFAPGVPPAGNVAFASQSGALALALIDLAAAKGLGVSSFASVGNRADITGNDLLEYWEQDPRSRLALLYLESFSDPRRFARVARRVGRTKPIVAVKSGRSGPGARAAGSHTGAMLAASDRATDALFEQTGVVRAESLGELLDVASLLSSQPLPRGPRVGIVTNAGGPGIMCADACEAAGLGVPELGPEVREELRAFLPSTAALGNPVDLIATAGADDYRRAIGALARCEQIDALIVIFIRPLQTDTGSMAGAIHEAVAELPREIPVQAVFMSPEDHAALQKAARVPIYLYPEEAVRALAKAHRHARWRARRRDPARRPAGIREAEASALLAEAMAEGPGWLGADACLRLLDCYGIQTPRSSLDPDPESAGASAAEIGGPVALKAVGPEITHKTEIGAVRLGLEGAAEVEQAAREMMEGLRRRGLAAAALQVQALVEGEVELILGIASDPVFGPVIACGAGGTTAELLGDVQVRVSPLDAADPGEMLDGLSVRPLLAGYRGRPPVDVEALEGLIARVDAIARAHHEIAEMDLNPVLATTDGAVAVDCRVRVEPRDPQPSWPRAWSSA